MKPLPNTYSKNGFHYELVVRDGPYAIFKQRLRPGAGCLAYEVIKIKCLKEAVMFGRTIEAHEVGPSNEDFGKSGWTYPTLARAKEKFRQLIEQVEK